MIQWLLFALVACNPADPSPAATDSTATTASSTPGPTASASGAPAPTASASAAPSSAASGDPLTTEQANERATIQTQIDLLQLLIAKKKTLPKGDPELKLFRLDGLVTYDEKTDPNKLLGRPGQYIGKWNWKLAGDEGTIEVFANAEDAKRRADRSRSIGEASPLLLKYVFLHPTRHLVLRLPKALTPAEAKKWEAVLLAL